MSKPETPSWLDVPLQRELLGEVIMNCRYSYSKGHDYDKNHVVSDKHTPYLTISCSRGTSWNSDKWETLQEAYENKGYKTYLRKSSGTTRTMSGTSKHAPTTMYVWNRNQIGKSPKYIDNKK